MTLVEVLEKLEEGQLQNLVWWWRKAIAQEIEGPFPRNVNDLNKAECIEYLSQRVLSLDEATSVRAFNKIQSTKVQIRSGNIPKWLTTWRMLFNY